MQQTVDIQNARAERVGSIAFADGSRLSAQRTAAGFKLILPIELSLRVVAQDDPIPLVTNVVGVLFSNYDNQGIELGEVFMEAQYQSTYSTTPNAEYDTQSYLVWRGAMNQLALFGKLRAGRPPHFQVQLRGELSYLLPSNHVRHLTRSEPHRFHGSTEIKYPAEIWVDRLRTLGVIESVLIEIPLPTSPPGPWGEVWKSLVEARSAFESGGTTGWRGCVNSVRVALETWRAIEPEDMGPGWKSSPGNSKDRTKEQRLDNLRWHLHQCAHHWMHNQAAQCLRDDALLMLSTLSALLAQRNP